MWQWGGVLLGDSDSEGRPSAQHRENTQTPPLNAQRTLGRLFGGGVLLRLTGSSLQCPQVGTTLLLVASDLDVRAPPLPGS